MRPGRIEKADSVQLTRIMLNRQLAAQQVHVVTSKTLRNFRLANGGVKAFLKTTAAIQKLPSFGGRMRE